MLGDGGGRLFAPALRGLLLVVRPAPFGRDNLSPAAEPHQVVVQPGDPRVQADDRLFLGVLRLDALAEFAFAVADRQTGFEDVVREPVYDLAGVWTSSRPLSISPRISRMPRASCRAPPSTSHAPRNTSPASVATGMSSLPASARAASNDSTISLAQQRADRAGVRPFRADDLAQPTRAADVLRRCGWRRVGITQHHEPAPARVRVRELRERRSTSSCVSTTTCCSRSPSSASTARSYERSTSRWSATAP